MGTTAKLGGKTLVGAVSWRLAYGTSPVQTTVDLRESDANALLSGKVVPQTLSLGTTGHSSKTFKGIYVIQNVPGDGPPTPARVLISDRRWLWPSFHYKRSFNMTRQVGTKWLNNPGQVLENATLAPNVVYQPWSLIDNVTPWTAETMLKNLGEAIKKCEQDFNGNAPNIVYSGVAAVVQGTPIQDLELDGPLDECIERALAYLPGVAVYIDPVGNVVFSDTNDNSENAAIKGPEAVGRGHVVTSDLSRIRPSKVRVLFDVRAELLFRFEDAGPGATSDARGNEDGLWCRNVAPVPDPYVTINGAQLATNSWAELDSLYTCPEWGNTPGLGEPLSTLIVRQCMVPYLDSWTALINAGLAVPDADWSARIAAVQTHFRQTFQINRRWSDRFRGISASRVGTIDKTTGTLGKAPVYSDYAYLASQRSQYLEVAGSIDGAYILNVAAWPSDGVIGTDTTASAATLSVVDSDQGVVSIDFLADKFRVYEQALPSQVEIEGDNTTPGNSPANPGPTPYLGFSTRPIGWDLVGTSDKIPQLCARDKKAFIVTAVPGSPNDKAGLVAVEIEATDNSIPNYAGKRKCMGPVMEIRVGPNVETARVPWTDANGAKIAGFFTRKVGEGPIKIDDIKDLVMNYDGNPKQGASLKGIAQAAAAALYLSLRDRPIGAKETAFVPSAEPAGNLSAVQHTIDVGTGAIMTTFGLPDRIAPLDISRYLPESVKRFLNRTIAP